MQQKRLCKKIMWKMIKGQDIKNTKDKARQSSTKINNSPFMNGDTSHGCWKDRFKTRLLQRHEKVGHALSDQSSHSPPQEQTG